MDKRFIIIHPFELIRKGLWAILRETFHHEFILLPSIESLKDYSGLNDLYLIIIVGEALLHKQSEVFIEQLLGNGNKLEFILLSNSEAKNEGNNSIIAIDQQATKITDTVKEILEKHKPANNQFTELSEREKDVLGLVALGHTNKEIADKLFISIHTVISHRKNITEKLGIKSISGLTVYAILNKLIDTEHIDPSTLI